MNWKRRKERNYWEKKDKRRERKWKRGNEIVIRRKEKGEWVMEGNCKESQGKRKKRRVWNEIVKHGGWKGKRRKGSEGWKNT